MIPVGVKSCVSLTEYLTLLCYFQYQWSNGAEQLARKCKNRDVSSGAPCTRWAFLGIRAVSEMCCDCREIQLAIEIFHASKMHESTNSKMRPWEKSNILNQVLKFYVDHQLLPLRWELVKLCMAVGTYLGILKMTREVGGLLWWLSDDLVILGGLPLILVSANFVGLFFGSFCLHFTDPTMGKIGVIC